MTVNFHYGRISPDSSVVKYRIFISTLLLLLATPYCHAHGYTLDDANHIIEKNRASLTADPALKR